MSRRRIIVVILLTLLVIPFPTIVVPTWRMRIVDTFGNPCKDREVTTTWAHYTISVLGNGFHSGQQNTDGDGYVEFPTRTIWAPMIWRLIAPVLAYPLTLAHGSVGVYATIDTDEKVDRSKAWISWRPGEPLPQEIIVEPCQPEEPGHSEP